MNYELKHGHFSIIDIFEKKGINRESAEEIINLFKLIGKYNKQDHKVWSSEDKPIMIQSERIMREKISYIHLNSVKAGFAEEPQDYLFSSARNYYLDDDSLFKITKISLLD
ncbi:MAG: hypothetical protein D6813_13970 [Calditrichaeota bacterium]|nr:MAG: hypothetical protein D6813_13970 [Calditrichota bacterium]